jgi:hypothetical protein
MLMQLLGTLAQIHFHRSLAADLLPHGEELGVEWLPTLLASDVLPQEPAVFLPRD